MKKTQKSKQYLQMLHKRKTATKKTKKAKSNWFWK